MFPFTLFSFKNVHLILHKDGRNPDIGEESVHEVAYERGL
jgi:hypothetical protein